MSLPNASIRFLNGQLGQSTAQNTDSVFTVIGAASNAIPNTVIPVVDSSTIPALIGYGAAAELAAQILSNASTTVYVVAGAKAAGSIGSVSKSRAGAPALTVTSLLGLPGTPFAADYSNAGDGQIIFDLTNTPILSSTAAAASVSITTPGALGTAQATVVVGSTTTNNVLLTTGPITASGITFRAVLPTGGSFGLGDQFNAVATASDSAAAVVTILNVNDQGQAQWTYSLDGGVTTSSPISANLGAVSSTGDTQPVITIGGTAPAASHVAEIDFVQAGAAYGVTAQCSVSSGLMVHSGTGLATVTVTGLGSSGAEGFTIPLSYVLHVSTTGATTSATGYWTCNGSTFTGGGTSGSPITLNGTFTDSHNATGIVFTLDSGPGDLTTGDTYSITIQPQAAYKVTLDGSTGSTLYLPNTGVITTGISGPTVTVAHTNTDLFSYSATNPASTTSYSLYVYPAYSYQPKQKSGQKVGLNFAFAWSMDYEAGDSYTFDVHGPSIGNSDVLNALDVAQHAQGVDYSLVAINSNPATFATAGSLASSVNAVLMTQAEAPVWRFQSAVICGPAIPSSGAGSTSDSSTAAFITATGNLALERTAMACGADYIVSPLTGLTDLRNSGVGFIARLAADPVQQDPGAVSDGALLNVVRTTTPLSDATVFNGNRGMVSTTYNGLTGVYCAEGLTLAGVGSDYFSIENRRVIDKAAKFGRAALLPYVNTTTRTVPGKGTVTPQFAAQINANVQSQIQSNCTGNFQSVAVAASTTANVLTNGGIEPVTISVLPFGYFRQIDASIGFTI